MAPSDGVNKDRVHNTGRRRAIIVAGPTCSGKSALALHLALRFGGTVVNADSMQIYRELRILTARPTEAEEALAPHRLYGVRPAAEAGSVAWWRNAALEVMDQAALPILCGGTGMYLRALTAGLADVPPPGEAARHEARSLLAAEGSEALHARLLEADADTAATLRPSDGQRLARAWEVWRGTGRGLAFWLRTSPIPADYEFRVILLDPPRHALRASIAARFGTMLAQGAMAEVEQLVAQGLDPALPAMRAHGVPELTAVFRGETSLAEAERCAVLATGQYTRRQATWFRHQLLVTPERQDTINARWEGPEQLSERWMAGMQNFLWGSN
ncbi:tRNA (adenosine(37)-N6)-dimethylallyltransferase MiaA [Acidisphaera sp. L21]|uniref:tRNA (adenosine(37)-N6)-dimethylallyltransferase MiaA n=1 Tax=Acidisphaera sp. L21 TaxID=1641851 RepID=UPI00131BD1DC|nr:tRNA (adenosine(37)-N6)-dimethylallyltransferase MiaA [Acidisphaera sp. L21]